MPDNPSKLQNVQLTGEPSDGLAPGVVKPDGSAGGAILDGGIPSAAEQNVERCACNCEEWAHGEVISIRCRMLKFGEIKKNRYCRARKWDSATIPVLRLF